MIPSTKNASQRPSRQSQACMDDLNGVIGDGETVQLALIKLRDAARHRGRRVGHAFTAVIHRTYVPTEYRRTVQR